jgi:hypothetical protein
MLPPSCEASELARINSLMTQLVTADRRGTSRQLSRAMLSCRLPAAVPLLHRLRYYIVSEIRNQIALIVGWAKSPGTADVTTLAATCRLEEQMSPSTYVAK